MNITAIKALKDNYIWAITSHNANWCIVVDPGESTPVARYLDSLQLELIAILVTHHHNDHTGGIIELLKKYPHATLFAPGLHIHPNCVIAMENSFIHIPGTNLMFKVYKTPGHTLDHIVYYHDEGILFTGDTLFSGGCGRLFEGTYEQLFESLNFLKTFPDETKVYCAHEYTVNNLEFAKTVDPHNKNLINHLSKIITNITSSISLPSTIGLEKKINPFLRCENSDIIYSTQNNNTTLEITPLDTFIKLRKMKDNY